MNQIRSTWDLKRIGLLAFAGVVIVLSSMFGFELYSSVEWNLQTAVVFPAGLLLFATAFVFLASAHYSVTTSDIDIRSAFGRPRLEWKNVDRVWFQSNLFGDYVVRIRTKESSDWKRVALALVGNSREVGKAIIEATMFAEHEIPILGTPETTYGPPPYRIFISPNDHPAPHSTSNQSPTMPRFVRDSRGS